MNITKLNLGSFGKEAAEGAHLTHHHALAKNFSYFGKKEAREEPEFTKADLASKSKENHQQGYDEGYKKGKEETVQAVLLIEQETKMVAENIVNQLAGFLQSYEEQKKEYLRNMTKMTMIAIKRISEKVIKENTEEVLLQALEKSAAAFTRQAEITMKAKKNTLEKIQDKVDNILKAKDFRGVVRYVPDEAVAIGSCVIEWGESGVSINSSEVLKQIEENISEFLKSI